MKPTKNKMEYTIKQLSKNDVALFKDLLSVFGDAFYEMDTYQGRVPSDGYLASMLEKKNFIVVAAFFQDKVVGGLAAYVLDKFEQDRREVYIYDLAVLETHRRQGIATNLINELRGIAKKIKAYVIFVQADPEDAPAIKLYESLGKKEEVFHFDISVD